MRSIAPRIEVVGARSRRGGAVLVSVLAACVLILSAQAPGRGRRGTVLQEWILAASAPLAHAAAAASRAGSSAVSSVTGLFGARSENARLREDLARREAEVFRLRAELAQRAAERALEGASALPNVVGPAPVLLLERRAGLQSIVIGRGATRGVEAGSPVATPEGLVGRVVVAGRTLSRAQLLLDATAAAGARIARTGEIGIVRGDGGSRVHLQNIPTTSTVKPGDLVETAGIDGIYPRGIPIGHVEAVARGSDLFLEIRVLPSASFSKLQDVLVLTPSPAAAATPEGTRGANR
ncbi:MAG TPA: rod shape-determining protein MreC [Thermoanaerobaculia bacterium]|jgi:rod shape-determining protein MreC